MKISQALQATCRFVFLRQKIQKARIEVFERCIVEVKRNEFPTKEAIVNASPDVISGLIIYISASQKV